MSKLVEVMFSTQSLPGGCPSGVINTFDGVVAKPCSTVTLVEPALIVATPLASVLYIGFLNSLISPSARFARPLRYDAYTVADTVAFVDA